MNIILLEEHELGRSLSRRDPRTIHLLKVLHKKAGDVFEAGILGGMRGMGKIEKINFDGSIFVSLNVTEPPVPKLPIRIAVGFVRPIQIRRLLRDLSSMGVSAIDLVGTELGEKSYRDTKLLNGGSPDSTRTGERGFLNLSRTACCPANSAIGEKVTGGGAKDALIEGAVQARDTIIPALVVYNNLEEWLKERPWVKPDESRIPLLLVMDNVRSEGSFFHLGTTSRPMVLAVGPERGWSDRERDLFEQAGFLRLSMGNRALRTETACVAAAVLAMEKIEEAI